MMISTKPSQGPPTTEDVPIFDSSRIKKHKPMPFKDFLNERDRLWDVVEEQERKEGVSEEAKYIKSMLYLDNMPILLGKSNLVDDIKKPEYMSKFMNNRSIGLTLWSKFNRKPQFNKREMLICMVKGAETFRMVSAIYKPNMYSGVFEGLDPADTPVDLFESDPSQKAQYKLI